MEKAGDGKKNLFGKRKWEGTKRYEVGEQGQ